MIIDAMCSCLCTAFSASSACPILSLNFFSSSCTSTWSGIERVVKKMGGRGFHFWDVQELLQQLRRQQCRSAGYQACKGFVIPARQQYDVGVGCIS